MGTLDRLPRNSHASAFRYYIFVCLIYACLPEPPDAAGRSACGSGLISRRNARSRSTAALSPPSRRRYSCRRCTPRFSRSAIGRGRDRDANEVIDAAPRDGRSAASANGVSRKPFVSNVARPHRSVLIVYRSTSNQFSATAESDSLVVNLRASTNQIN